MMKRNKKIRGKGKTKFYRCEFCILWRRFSFAYIRVYMVRLHDIENLQIKVCIKNINPYINCTNMLVLIQKHEEAN